MEPMQPSVVKMNLELLEQFGQNYPEEIEATLDYNSFATIVAFNRRGTFIAAGYSDGRLIIWDFSTKSIAKSISAHVLPITALSWNRNGKLLATSSDDCHVRVWDVLTSTAIISWNLEAAIQSVQFCPRNENILLINALRQQSHLVQYEILPDGSARTTAQAKLPPDDENEIDVVSSFDRRGRYLFTGSSKGRMQMFRLEKGTINFTLVTSFRVCNSAIKQIEFAPKNKEIFLVSCGDRAIRLFDMQQVFTHSALTSNQPMSKGGRKLNPTQSTSQSNGLESKIDLEPMQKFTDLVNRSLWKKCVFSGSTSDYVCAGSSRSNSLCIWDRNAGNLITILKGNKGETINDVIWHPIRPVIVSVSNGIISIWSQQQMENWSAFAPDFKELEENVEYEERESEFDEYDEDRSPVIHSNSNNEEDIIIDVEKIDKNPAFISSDEDEEDPDELVFSTTVDLEEIEPDIVDEDIDDNILSNVGNRLSNNQ